MNQAAKWTIVKEIWEIVYNIEDQTQRAYIISDEDYEGIVSEAGYDQMKYFISVSSPDITAFGHHMNQAAKFLSFPLDGTI